MKALCFDGTSLSLCDREPPRRGRGEALVRVRMAGICNTDLEIARGYMGFTGVLGHEFVGTVEEADDPAWIGARVVGEINLDCGRCDLCERGLGRHCRTRSVLGILGKDGCFAEQLTLPLANLHRVPDAIDDIGACFVEPLAACYEILEQVRMQPGDRVAVLGDGKLGQLIASVLQAQGLCPTLVGKHPAKLALASARGLATAVASSPTSELPAKNFDVVVEATGSPAGLSQALELLRPRGTLVLKSTYHGAVSLDAAPIVIDEITLVGSRCGPFPPALETLARGAIDAGPLVHAVYPLEKGQEAFERASASGVLKILLAMA